MVEEYNKNDKRDNDSQKRKNLVLKIIIGVLLIIIIILLLFRCSTDGIDKPVINMPTPTISDAPDVDPNAGEYVEPETQGPSKGVAIPGWGSIIIPANKKEVVVDFYNPEANHDLYYLTFEIRIPNDSEEGYEVLYTSGLVEPGLHIQNISLNREVEAGEYDAIIHVQPYRISDKSRTNNADLKTKLIAK